MPRSAKYFRASIETNAEDGTSNVHVQPAWFDKPTEATRLGYHFTAVHAVESLKARLEQNERELERQMNVLRGRISLVTTKRRHLIAAEQAEQADRAAFAQKEAR